MTDKRQPGVLGSLPRTRPHRRSDKRPAAAAPATVPEPAAKKAAAPPVGEAKSRRTPTRETASAPAPVPGTLVTAVQAAAELAEIGLQASARALRRTLSRLPRP